MARPGERSKVVDRPWSINGQILAVEEWRRAFLSTEEAITAALLWIRLPNLPAEFWGEAALQHLVEDVGEFVMADSFTVERRRLGFARVCVRVELGRPLIPGVRIDGPAGPYWQRYAYENLECLCPDCGSVLHLQGKCRGAGGSRSAAGSVESPEMVEHGEETASVRRGAWMFAVRRWSSDTGKSPLSSGSAASSQPVTTPAADGGWRLPSKVARRGRGSPPPAPSVPVGTGLVGTKTSVLSRASPESRPNNPFAVLGRPEVEDILPALSGPPSGLAHSKRARLLDGPAGRPGPSGPSGSGPSRSRKGPGSARAKGKGPAEPMDLVLRPVGGSGRSSFHFSAGVGAGSVSQPDAPSSAESRSVSGTLPVKAGGASVGQEAIRESVNPDCLVDHEVAASCLRQAIIPYVAPLQMELVPPSQGVDEVMAGEDPVEIPSPNVPSL